MNVRSLSFRLVAWYAGLLTIVFVLLGALTFMFLRHYLEANLLDIQLRRARQIADTLLAAASRKGDEALAREVDDLYSPEANQRFIRITRGDGRLMYASGMPADDVFNPSTVPMFTPAEAWSLQSTRTHSLLRKEILPGGGLLIAALAYSAPDQQRYIVEVGASTAGTEATLTQLLFMLALGLPAAILIAVGGGFVLVRRALTPVDQLAHKAEEITQHNLSERLPVVRTGDELEHLANSLNHMISRLEEAILSSKRFVADASHELRTPLTVIRGELESLAQSAQLPCLARESLGSVLEEVVRLSEIVEGLLALSRLDAGEGQSEHVSFDLADLTATTSEQMSLLAEDKSITVVCETTPGVTVRGDRARVKQVIVNLLGNAIKYTPTGGNVRLRVARESGWAILEVTDDGIGIPPEALPHVFKRFFRADDSRSREPGGAGLGLSIAKSICNAHGAQLDVHSIPGKGSCFRIRHPLADARATSE